ncbi:MAG: thiamine pyrophosphate-dependent enzyme, partial [Myxococcota bacterium]|nr:thiamine pyrophosphate-dependent enzyme [Myxococcota bacterium]
VTGARPYKLAPASGTPGARALHAVGLSATTGSRVLCILGDASTAAGAFHEALNAACLLGAKVTFLVVCQPLGEGAPIGTQLATTPARLAAAFDIPITETGSDEDAVASAVGSAREADGPALIQVTLHR